MASRVSASPTPSPRARWSTTTSSIQARRPGGDAKQGERQHADDLPVARSRATSSRRGGRLDDLLEVAGVRLGRAVADSSPTRRATRWTSSSRGRVDLRDPGRARLRRLPAGLGAVRAGSGARFAPVARRAPGSAPACAAAGSAGCHARAQARAGRRAVARRAPRAKRPRAAAARRASAAAGGRVARIPGACAGPGRSPETPPTSTPAASKPAHEATRRTRGATASRS